jgi:hypothetical protein
MRNPAANVPYAASSEAVGLDAGKKCAPICAGEEPEQGEVVPFEHVADDAGNDAFANRFDCPELLRNYTGRNDLREFGRHWTIHVSVKAPACRSVAESGVVADWSLPILVSRRSVGNRLTPV